jgi:hypothetical protein
MSRVPVTGCDKADCPVKKCLCSCHDGQMDHMFECCAPLKCEKCGVVVKNTAVDGGVYYKEK